MMYFMAIPRKYNAFVIDENALMNVAIVNEQLMMDAPSAQKRGSDIKAQYVHYKII